MKTFVKIMLVLTVLLVNSISVNAYENDTILKEVVVAPFNNLIINGPFTVIIEQGDVESLFIEAEKEMFNYIKTSEKNKSLKISFETGVNSSVEFDDIKLRITVRDLEELNLNGFIDLNVLNTFKTNALLLICDGATKAIVHIDTKSLTCTMSSFSDLTIKGVSDNLFIEKLDASSMNALQLESKNVSIKSSGMGELNIYATEELKVEAEGAVKISYKGNPAKRQISVKELSTIKKI